MIAAAAVAVEMSSVVDCYYYPKLIHLYPILNFLVAFAFVAVLVWSPLSPLSDVLNVLLIH